MPLLADAVFRVVRLALVDLLALERVAPVDLLALERFAPVDLLALERFARVRPDVLPGLEPLLLAWGTASSLGCTTVLGGQS